MSRDGRYPDYGRDNPPMWKRDMVPDWRLDPMSKGPPFQRGPMRPLPPRREFRDPPPPHNAGFNPPPHPPRVPHCKHHLDKGRCIYVEKGCSYFHEGIDCFKYYCTGRCVYGSSCPNQHRQFKRELPFFTQQKHLLAAENYPAAALRPPPDLRTPATDLRNGPDLREALRNNIAIIPEDLPDIQLKVDNPPVTQDTTMPVIKQEPDMRDEVKKETLTVKLEDREVPRKSPTPKLAAVNLGSEWKQYFNASGIPYYFNKVTKETTWTNPSTAKAEGESGDKGDKKSSDKDQKPESKVSASRTSDVSKDLRRQPITNATAVAEKDPPLERDPKRRDREADDRNPKRRKMDSPTKPDLPRGDVDLRATLSKDVDLRTTLARNNVSPHGPPRHPIPHIPPHAMPHAMHPHAMHPHPMHPHPFPPGRDLRDSLRAAPPQDHRNFGRAGGEFPRGYTPNAPSYPIQPPPYDHRPPRPHTRDDHPHPHAQGGGVSTMQHQSPRTFERQHNNRSPRGPSHNSGPSPRQPLQQSSTSNQPPQTTNSGKVEPNNVDSAEPQNEPSVADSVVAETNERPPEPMETEEWEEPQIYTEPITPAQREEKYQARIARALSNAVILPALAGYDLFSELQEKKESLGSLVSSNNQPGVFRYLENGFAENQHNGFESQDSSQNASVLNSAVCSLSGLKALVPSLAVVVLSGFLNVNEGVRLAELANAEIGFETTLPQDIFQTLTEGEGIQED